MALSEHEQRVLAELEKQLTAEEPRLAASMAPPQASKSISARRWVLSLLGIVAGLGGVLVGIWTKNVLFGALGFGLLAFSGYSLFSPPARPASTSDQGAGHRVSKASKGKSRSAKHPNSFMKNLEDRWEQRHRGQF